MSPSYITLITEEEVPFLPSAILSGRTYCTLMEMFQDLSMPGARDEATMMRYIKDASDWIDRELGNFIPITEAKRLDGEGGIDLWVPPLLTVGTIVDDANTLLTTDYLLYPRSRCWENGPYIRITLDPDATTIGSWSNEADIIVITARWGLFELSRLTGATVASQDASSTSLEVDTAVEISPGWNWTKTRQMASSLCVY